MLKGNTTLKSFLIGAGVLSMLGCANIGEEPAEGLKDTKKVFIDVNGALNGMFITSTDESNPVLLFISGGPGVPEVWLNEAYDGRYPNRIGEYFTVCYWDYYGEGLSYNPNIKAQDITIERLATDAHTVAEYLKAQYGKEKIYLMAHSSGSNLGLHLAQTNAEDFYCYFGMGQDAVGTDASSGSEGIRRYEEGYNFIKAEWEKSGNSKGIQKMNKLFNVGDGVFSVKDPSSIGGEWEKILLEAGCGTTREMRSDARDIFFKNIDCSCYTLREKINYWEGKILCSKSAFSSYKVDWEKPALIPVHFLSGYYDYTTPITLSKKLCDKIEAPEKSFCTFENSAHSPLWEENELVIKEMLKYVR